MVINPTNAHFYKNLKATTEIFSHVNKCRFCKKIFGP
jgi:hypothetical protein